MKSTFRNTAIFFAALILSACAVQAQTDNPSYGIPQNPIINRFNDVITFYASFDGYETADLSVGNGAPAKAVDQPVFSNGIVGKALHSQPNRLDYDSQNNVDFSQPGSVAVWISPQDWQPQKEPAYIFWINIMTGDGHLMLARMGNAANKENLYAWCKKGESAKSVVMGNTQKWSNGWHLLVANWGENYIEFSVDGAPFSRATLTGDIAQTDGAKGHVFIGGGNSASPYLMDELYIFDRPLSNDEVQWMYQTQN